TEFFEESRLRSLVPADAAVVHVVRAVSPAPAKGTQGPIRPAHIEMKDKSFDGNRMQSLSEHEPLFPAFARFATESGLIDKAKGNLAAKIPRILGQGTTRAVGLDFPPAVIERKMELATLKSGNLSLPNDVMEEIRQAEIDTERLKSELQREEG